MIDLLLKDRGAQLLVLVCVGIYLYGEIYHRVLKRR